MTRPAQKTPSFAIALSPKMLVQRLLFALLMLISVIFIFSSRQPGSTTMQLQGRITDGAVPFLDALAHPVESFSGFMSQLQQLTAIHDNNQLLLEENERLKRYEMLAAQLQSENASLKQLLQAVPMHSTRYATARIVSEGAGAFSRSAIINGGVAHGINAGQAVISQDGVVGRVIQAGQQSARILFLHDINSKIPVMTEDGAIKAIVGGTNERLLEMRYMPANSSHLLSAGMKLITSGDGGVFPEGLPVGNVAQILPNGTIRVAAHANTSSVRYVTIIQQPDVVAPPEEE